MTEMSHEVHRIEVEIIGLCVRIRCIATKDRRKVDFDTFSLASPVGKGSDWIAAPKPLPQVPEQGKLMLNQRRDNRCHKEGTEQR